MALPIEKAAAGKTSAAEEHLRILGLLERKLLWLSSWMIHHANHVRPNRDGLKVGGHQASSASVVTPRRIFPSIMSRARQTARQCAAASRCGLALPAAASASAMLRMA